MPSEARPPISDEKLKELIRKADPDRADAITLLVRRNSQQAATIERMTGLLLEPDKFWFNRDLSHNKLKVVNDWLMRRDAALAAAQGETPE